MKKLFVLPLCFYGLLACAQNVGIGTPTPHPSALLDITSTSQGVLVPRVSLSNVFSAAPVTAPASGLLVWNTNEAVSNGQGTGFYYWAGSRWQKLPNAAEGWSLQGNSGVDTLVNFIGTTDNVGLVFRVANQKAGGIFPTGNNIFLGKGAGQSVLFNPNNFNGGHNTFIGADAGGNEVAGIGHTYIGSRAGINSSAQVGNTMVGYNAGATPLSGSFNTALGQDAGQITSGFRNVAIGALTGAIGPGRENVMIGFNVGNFIQGGNGNVWIGNQVATGNFGISPKFNSDNNVIIGDSAAHRTNGAQANVFIGKRSGFNSVSSRFNVFVGDSTGINNEAGNQNTFIGSKARASLSGYSNSTAIGANALVAGNNVMVLGGIEGINGATSDVNVGIGLTNPTRRFHIRNSASGSGVISNTNSSVVVERGGANNYLSMLAASGFETGFLFGIAGAPNASVTGGIMYNSGGTPHGLQFRTNGNNTRMSIDANGNVGIGTQGPSHRLHVLGNILATGTITPSDERFKKNMTAISS
ncbi:MAG TPA: hypothetical protein VK907_13210, partial [Phnomibacter sp.]|nr:hypothetical protein [Phnomibacter sp.]